MNKGAVLIDAARGNLLDRNALTATLSRSAIGALFLDVPTPHRYHPKTALWGLQNGDQALVVDSGRSIPVKKIPQK